MDRTTLIPDRRRRNARRGGTLIFMTVSMVAAVSVGSLAVDWGRVEMAKTELERGTVAAARYAAKGVSDGTALSKANSLGSDNSVDNSALVFNTSDVETGTWDSTANAFTAGGSSPNAVRVTGRRTAATGNPVSLIMGQIVGRNSCDVVVKAVAKINIGGYGVVGLNSISMSGNSSDSYWSAGGSTAPGYGSIASNGNITLSGNSSIHGNASPGTGKSVSGGTVSGSTTPLTATLSYPNGNAGTYASTNDDANLGSAYNHGTNNFTLSGNGTYTYPGGNYYVNNFSVGSNASVSFSGPTTLYCYGNFSMSGGASTSASIPGNLTIVMCPDAYGNPPGSVSIGSSSALYATIYAPQSNVTLSGSGDLYGSVLGLTVSMTGTSAVHYDLALVANNGTISLVQ